MKNNMRRLLIYLLCVAMFFENTITVNAETFNQNNQSFFEETKGEEENEQTNAEDSEIEGEAEEKVG